MERKKSGRLFDTAPNAVAPFFGKSCVDAVAGPLLDGTIFPLFKFFL